MELGRELPVSIGDLVLGFRVSGVGYGVWRLGFKVFRV